jgi:alpha-L-rhamnosidase
MLHTSNHRVDRLSFPRGIVAAHPEFTWELASDHAGDLQTACAVEVALRSASGQMTSCWESGKLVQPIGASVHYAGTPLESRSDYQWRVKVWDADNIECAWSNWSGFETGIIAPDQWSARWISGGGALRGSFPVERALVRARAYVSGLGYYEFFCNGEKVSAATLAPSYTDFDRRVEYEIIDLLPALQEGENRCGFLLADGWWRFSPPAQKRRVQALAEIVLEYADGRREVRRTDETWQTNAGPFLPEAEASPHQLFDGVHLDLGWLQKVGMRASGARR